MRSDIWTCDICGVRQSDPAGSHWAVAFVERAQVCFTSWQYHCRPEALHLCGEGCAGKLLSREMSKQKSPQSS